MASSGVKISEWSVNVVFVLTVIYSYVIKLKAEALFMNVSCTTYKDFVRIDACFSM